MLLDNSKILFLSFSSGIPTGDFTYLELLSISISGVINKDVDRTIPPLGVALPVKFVLPAEIVRGILQ